MIKKVIPELHGWALDESGNPTPVGMALKKSKGYRCPVCRGDMRVRTKNSKHYFYHESVDDCTPEQVADALGGKWLLTLLNEMLIRQETCPVTWEIEDHRFTADVLLGVTTIIENSRTHYGTPDIALLNEEGKLRAVLFWRTLEDELIRKFGYHGIPSLVVQSETFYSGLINNHFVFKTLDVLGGWWLDRFSDALVLEPDTVRDLFRQMVSEPPFHFCGSLEPLDETSCVLSYKAQHVWMPYPVFELVIGGTRNTIGDITIIKQTWHQKDHSEIDIFHVTRRKRDGSKECAVGVRRSFPQVFQAQRSTISMQAVKAHKSAQEIACELAMQ
ncbi:MAG: hypothetical protein F9K27_13595 [Anaerolineae bacterium]|nr:MAG: hypothetical protein F9K27_13595 [Anaerolineae bacterium]